MDVTVSKRGRGRPRVDNPMSQITFRISLDLIEAIDAIAEQETEHDRSRVIRDLIRIGLKHRKKAPL